MNSSLSIELKKENKPKNLYKVGNLNNAIIPDDKEKKMEEIINIIEKNPSTLKKLNVNRLKIIDDYYVKQIDMYKKKLLKMVNN